MKRAQLKSDITSDVRQAIREGRYMPNERLIEAELAATFKTNRANVRTALARLEQEGLVSHEPNRGARVRVVGDEEALEMALARGALEKLLARQAATSGTKEDRKKLTALLATVSRVREVLNPGLAVDGLVLTMFDGRNSLARQVQDEVRSHFGAKVFRTAIPRNVRLSESPSHGLPVLLYDPASRGAQAYRALAQEVLAAHGEEVPPAAEDAAHAS